MSRHQSPPIQEPRRRWLAEMPIVVGHIGYGALGSDGHLGYENQRVRVRGREYLHALSAHGPSEIRIRLAPGTGWFRCEAAINDDVVGRPGSADFLVLADDRVVGVAVRVGAGEVPRPIEVRLQGVQQLRLRVEAAQRNFCHSVWLDPTWEESDPGPIQGWRDALGRVEVASAEGLEPTGEAIVTVVSPGYDRWLDQMLGSLAVHGRCAAATRYVFAIEPDRACEAVIQRHRSVAIRCRRVGPLNAGVKAVLYSAASLIEADRYLCLDADTLVLGGLGPVFDSLKALPSDRILVARDAFLRPGTLGDQLIRHYAGKPGDIARILGRPEQEEGYPLVVNDGVFAGGRRALLGVESLLRSWTQAVPWLDERGDHGWRNQFLFNLALARLHCGVELDEVINLQMHMNDVTWSRDGEGPVRAEWRGRAGRILHFCGWGRDKATDWRAAAAAGPKQPSLP